ncbi:MAG: hypothetical protein BJ554DRAFT_3314 [Olpidium bornovanus]|uniref:Uncharacterized protein n=1 Tax=Olpidium bornovanus TaxID=278681 RepID=A0A8H8A0P1_9FUNG|nr:MAG: hypothetical protein BJ554DRAFT_3314 [Olpidium bornovanus]
MVIGNSSRNLRLKQRRDGDTAMGSMVRCRRRTTSPGDTPLPSHLPPHPGGRRKGEKKNAGGHGRTAVARAAAPPAPGGSVRLVRCAAACRAHGGEAECRSRRRRGGAAPAAFLRPAVGASCAPPRPRRPLQAGSLARLRDNQRRLGPLWAGPALEGWGGGNFSGALAVPNEAIRLPSGL